MIRLLDACRNTVSKTAVGTFSLRIISRMQKSLCVDLFAHKRVRNLGQVERYRMRDVHPPLISKEEWREAKNRISMPDREAVILEEITGEGILSSLHPILFKEDIDV